MQLSFDLISDLDLASNNYDYKGMATSPICVVAGGVSEDRDATVAFLKHLTECYQQILYIDGSLEHKSYGSEFEVSILDLKRKLSKIKGVQYLHDDVVVINGVAFVGTNGWWGFSFDPDIDADLTRQWYANEINYAVEPDQILLNSINDASYLVHTIKKLQTHQDIKKIVIVSHTVPNPELIAHDIELSDTYEFNVMGNELLDAVKLVDLESKIHTWCFGHYHGSVDQRIDNVRYINNCQGQPGDTHYQYAYYPKKVIV